MDDDPVELPSRFSLRAIEEWLREEAWLVVFFGVWALGVGITMLAYPGMRSAEGLLAATAVFALGLVRVVIRRARRGCG